MRHAARRPGRLGEVIQREVSIMLQRDIKDPRLQGLVTVVETKVSRDLQRAEVYVSVYGSDEERRQVMEGLRQAAGYVRHELWKRLKVKKVPEIRFVLDQRVEDALRIERLLRGEEGSSG